MLINILVAIAGWLILMFVGTNLLGLFVRGFFTDPELEKLKKEGGGTIREEIRKNQRAGNSLNVISFVLICVYFFALVYFWNFGVLVVAVMIMAGRFPDLIWEIKHGKKINVKKMPKNFIYFLTTFLGWAALPVLYYSLFYLK